MIKITVPKLITTLSLTIFLILPLHFQTASSFQNDDELQEYIIDNDDPIYINPTRVLTKRRFLKSTDTTRIIEGAQCEVNPTSIPKGNPNHISVCNGAWANDGQSLLYCCQKHCQDVLADCNNCGQCGKKCNFGEICCGGICVNTMKDTSNCGSCGKKCGYGVKCEYGYCGYA